MYACVLAWRSSKARFSLVSPQNTSHLRPSSPYRMRIVRQYRTGNKLSHTEQAVHSVAIRGNRMKSAMSLRRGESTGALICDNSSHATTARGAGESRRGGTARGGGTSCAGCFAAEGGGRGGGV